MWRRYLRFWGADPPADIDNEISFHLEELVKHLSARGLSEDEARVEAARRFGDVARVRSECVSAEERSIRVSRRRDGRDALSQDVRDAYRSLTKNRGFTLGAALILALGIGLNTTSFSFNKALLFPALPVGDPAGIARMWSQNMARGIFATPLSEGDFADLTAASRSFEDVAAYAIEPVTLTGGREAERIPAIRATTSLLRLLRVSPVLGRGFGQGDALTNATPAAILTDRTWRNRFGGDPSVIGRDIVLNGKPHTIVGVLAERFWFESKEVEVWLPRALPRADAAREPRSLMAIARLRTGTTIESAQAEMQSLARRLAREQPRTNAGWDIHVSGLLPFGPGEKVFLGLVMTLTSLLLAAACAHIANLLLARGMERRGEIAIRSALGARRGRIVRQLFVESIALSIVGGACSLLVAIPIITQIRVVLGTAYTVSVRSVARCWCTGDDRRYGAACQSPVWPGACAQALVRDGWRCDEAALRRAGCRPSSIASAGECAHRARSRHRDVRADHYRALRARIQQLLRTAIRIRVRERRHVPARCA